MVRSTVGKVVVLLAMISVLALPAAAADNGSEAPSGDNDPGTPPGVVHQDKEAALAHDMALTAEQSDLPLADVERAIAFQQAFSEFVDDELLPQYADQISAIWVDPVPATQGHVQFTGEVPREVVAEATRRGLDVVFTGGGEISMAEHSLRAELAAKALDTAGYQHFVTFSDRKNGVIQIELKLPESAPQPDKADLLDLVQEQVAAYRSRSGEPPLEGRAAEVRSSDLELTIITGTGPLVNEQHSRGGNRVRDTATGGDICTSGWSVSGPSGDGIITAGHCGSLDQFEQADGLTYSMTFRGQDYGATSSSSDVEYHTTAHVELAEFYSDATSIRPVAAIKTTSAMVGKAVCFYGRSSNVRTCNHTVEAVDTCFGNGLPGGVTCKQARATNNSGVGGDSGGGWSYGQTAWGTFSAYAGDDAYFTPVKVAQNALGVTILTQ